MNMQGKDKNKNEDEDSDQNIDVDPFETATLERLDRQESLKFLLRLKREHPDGVILPKQFHYSMESVPVESETGE